MKINIAVVVFFLVSSVTSAFSFDAEPVLESQWYGRCKQYTDLFVGGVAYIDYHMYNMNYSSYDYSISGTFKSTIKIDGYTYVSICSISGSYDPYNHQVRLYPGYVSREDQLPGDMYWIYSDIKTTLYTDRDRYGYYLLQGYTLDDYGYNQSQVEFSNNPYYA